jgi:membrane-associated HD superfamily phosphohydrolase
MEGSRLSEVLLNLVSRGELREEDAQKVSEEYAKLERVEGSRRKVVPEITGYLGALFILISTIILVSGRWQHLAKMAQFGVFLSIALLFFVTSIVIGNSTAAKTRLIGLLNVLASISVTIAILVLKAPGHEVPALAIFTGWFLVLVTFKFNRSILGEISLAGFSLAAGISGIFLIQPHPRNTSYLFAIVLSVVGLGWLFFANSQFFNRTLGDAIGIGALFLSGQLMFNGELRFVTYLMSLVIVGIALWLYSRTFEWPLLVGLVLVITVGTGEFVGGTLGGSIGAALGLLTSGVLFVTGSVYSFKKIKQQI